MLATADWADESDAMSGVDLCSLRAQSLAWSKLTSEGLAGMVFLRNLAQRGCLLTRRHCDGEMDESIAQ